METVAKELATKAKLLTADMVKRLLRTPDVADYEAAFIKILAPRDGRVYLVWSNEHMKWWNPHEKGYTDLLSAAGLYTYEEARAICDEGHHPNNPPHEVTVLDPRLPLPS